MHCGNSRQAQRHAHPQSLWFCLAGRRIVGRCVVEVVRRGRGVVADGRHSAFSAFRRCAFNGRSRSASRRGGSAIALTVHGADSCGEHLYGQRYRIGHCRCLPRDRRKACACPHHRPAPQRGGTLAAESLVGHMLSQAYDTGVLISKRVHHAEAPDHKALEQLPPWRGRTLRQSWSNPLPALLLGCASSPWLHAATSRS